MTFYYAQKIKSEIIDLIEEGELSTLEIAETCNVGPSFVRKVREAYMMDNEFL